jgi:hypothetical protein
MKKPTITMLALALAIPLLPVWAQDEAAATEELPIEVRRAQDSAKHQLGATKLAGEQDELSADVQELIEEQTAEEVIGLLEEVEGIMAEITGSLDESDTGGPTIAAETEVIEKIFEAAKKRSQQQGQGESQGTPGAMLDMMERMMGQQPGGDKPGQQPGQQPGDQAGEGMTGDSDAANTNQEGTVGGPREERRVPKSAGTTGTGLPPEFQKALDSYNNPSERSTSP